MSKLTLSPLIKTREEKRWALTPRPAMLQDQATACPYDKCGKFFSEPIELTVRMADSLETYFACPHCFSRVSGLDNLKKGLNEAPLKDLKKGLDEAPPKDRKKAIPEEAKGNEKNKPVGCAHFLEYLKTRPKNDPIPDDCLTCAALMKCI